MSKSIARTAVGLVSGTVAGLVVLNSAGATETVTVYPESGTKEPAITAKTVGQGELTKDELKTAIKKTILTVKEEPKEEEASPIKETETEGDLKIAQEPVLTQELSLKEDEPEEEVLEPVKEEIQDPVKEEVQEPVKEEVQEPVQVYAQEPVKEEAQEPVKEEVQDPVKEEVQEPVKEESQEPVKEEAQEPVKEEVQEPEDQASGYATETKPEVYVTETKPVVDKVVPQIEGTTTEVVGTEPSKPEDGYEEIEKYEDPEPVIEEPETQDDLTALNEKIVEEALKLVGVTDGDQCTEVVTQALNNAGISASVYWPDQYAENLGYYVETGVAGNLIYYDNGGPGDDHIAIYIGNDLAVHGNYYIDENTSVTQVAPVTSGGGGTPQFIQVTPQ